MRITVRIPQEPMYAYRVLHTVVETLTYRFGGTTVYDTRGSWLDEYGDLVYNRVWTVETYDNTGLTDADVGWEVHNIAEEAENLLQEDTIMYTINGNSYFS